MESVLLDASAEDFGANLAGMLAAVDPKAADIDGFNKSLAEAKIPFRLEHSKC